MSRQYKASSKPASAKNVIFNAAAVAERLSALRSVAVAAGQEESRWWEPALAFDWTSVRAGNNNTQWASVTYTDEAGVAGRLVVRFNGERHTGQIMPITDKDVAELTAKSKNPNMRFQKRDKKPAVQIQKWSVQVKTAEDGITILTGDDGRPQLPGDDKLSSYFAVAALVGEAFRAEADERVRRGDALYKKALDLKKKDKALGPQAVLEAFAVENGPRRPGDMILSPDNVTGLRKLFPDPRASEALIKGATISVVKIANLVQEYISDKAPRNKGAPLPNPMTRITLNFDGITGAAQLAVFDKGLPFTEAGRQRYDTGKVDGLPVNANSIHKFILPRSTLDGIANMDSICFSQMGISMPVKAEVLVVAQPSGREITLDDVYDDEGLGFSVADAFRAPALIESAGGAAEAGGPLEGEGEGEGEGADGEADTDASLRDVRARKAAAAKPAARAAPKPAAKPAAKTVAPPEEDDYDGLLSELSATSLQDQ
jgi:hypothetical protein